LRSPASGKLALALGVSLLAMATTLSAQCPNSFFDQPTECPDGPDAPLLTSHPDALLTDDDNNFANADNFFIVSPTEIDQIRVRGAWFDAPGEIQQDPPGADFQILIRADAAGLPGAIAYSYDLEPTTRALTGVDVFNIGGGGDLLQAEREFVFDLPTPAALIPGTYWLEVYQEVADGIWVWSEADVPDPSFGIAGRATATNTPPLVSHPGVEWVAQGGELSMGLCGDAIASACSVLFGQAAVASPTGFSISDTTLPPAAADNFVTADPIEICGFDFRGAYLDNTAPATLPPGGTFVIALHPDAGGFPAPPTFISPPLNPSIPPIPTGRFVDVGFAVPEQDFRFEITPPLVIPPGTYWVSIRNLDVEPPGGEWVWSNAAAPDPVYGIPGANTDPPSPPAPVERSFNVRAEVQANPCVNPVDVLVIAADSSAAHRNDVASLILGQLPGGSTVDTFDASTDTPTPAELSAYDAVFVYSYELFDDAATLGDNVAAFYDAGGAVVTAYAETAGATDLNMAGAWESGGYQAIVRDGNASGGSHTLGTLHHPAHPLLTGVTSFSADANSVRPLATTVTFGSLQVADWTSGNVLLATKIGAPAVMARPIVDLGFWPVSNAVDDNGWDNGGFDPDTDGEIILGNAIFHALGCTPFNPPTGSISDLVFSDDNANGIQDLGELGIDGVDVTLLDDTLAPLATDTTSGGGLYSFAGLLPAEYYLQFDSADFPANTFITLQDQGVDDGADSDVPQNNDPAGPIFITFGQDDDSWDLGLAPGATIGNYVWEDEDGDGIQDIDEDGLEYVDVDLIDDSDDSLVDSTFTDFAGFYEFADVAPGTYRVRVNLGQESNWYFTQVNAGFDDAVDSDILQEYANPPFGETDPFSVNVGDVEDTQDAGLFQLGAISDLVWLDIDDDGVQDPGEPGVEGVTVELSNTDLSVTDSTTTDASGNYSFAGLFPHDGYEVSFTLPPPGVPQISLFSPANQGGDDELDSDADVVVDADTQTAQNVAVTSGDDNDTVDCGTRDVTDPTATLECYPFGVFYSCTPNEDETFTVTFDEPVNLDDPAQVLVTNGTAGSFEPQCESGAPCDVWTFVVTATAEGTVTVQVGVGAFDDPATNDNTATDVCTYVYDITAPVEDCGGALTNLTPSITNDLILVFAVTFDEDVDGVDASDFAGSAAPFITSIDPTPGPAAGYTITVTVPGAGVYRLEWASEFGPDWIQDCAGNDFEGSDAFGVVEVIDDSIALTGSLQYDELTGFQADQFGWSVAQSGPVTFVGTPGDDDGGLSSGSVHVAEQDNAGSHPLTQKLVASDDDAADRFGESVAVDGDWGVVGANMDEAGAFTNAGSAYFFRRQIGTGVWGAGLGGTSEFQKVQSSVNAANWWFGKSVAIQGRTAIVGVPQGQSAGISTYRSGRAVIFEFDSCTETWTEVAQLVAFDAASYDGFGSSVAVFGSIALVGAPGDDDLGSGTGAVYAYRRTGPGVWVFDAKLIPAGSAAGDNVGTSVALFGNTAVIGCSGDDQPGKTNVGAICVMERTGPGTWTNLLPVSRKFPTDGITADLFGSSVAFDGQTIAVGSPLHNAAGVGADSGAVYTFSFPGLVQTHKFLSPLTTAADQLGTSVAVDGRRVVGGAPYGETRVVGSPALLVGNIAYFQIP